MYIVTYMLLFLSIKMVDCLVITDMISSDVFEMVITWYDFNKIQVILSLNIRDINGKRNKLTFYRMNIK